MKKFLVYLFKSPKLIYQKINECEENFLKRFDENYKSRLALNSIFYTLLSIVFVGVVPALLSGLNINLFLVSSIPSLLYTAIYLFIYLRKRVPMIEGRKWWYCIQASLGLIFGFTVITLPIALLLTIIYISVWVFLALLALWLVLLIIGGGSSSGSSKKRKWRLDNGDEVTESKGLLGESYYDGKSGKSYDTNDGGNTFYEK